MINIAIIEDEKNMADALISVIEEVAPECNIVSKAKSIKDGFKLFNTYKVELAFMDVELKDGLSFEILKQLNSIDFQIVFVTAHSHYAIDAFHYSAIDYIVKPIDSESVSRAIHRAKENLAQKKSSNNIQLLLDNLNAGSQRQKIVLQTADTNYYTCINDIVRCESENNYCHIHLVNGDNILVTKPLKEYERILPQSMFFRAHQSHLININHIKQIKKRSLKVVLTNGEKIPLAARRKEEILGVLKRFSVVGSQLSG